MAEEKAQAEALEAKLGLAEPEPASMLSAPGPRYAYAPVFGCTWLFPWYGRGAMLGQGTSRARGI